VKPDLADLIDHAERDWVVDWNGNPVCTAMRWAPDLNADARSALLYPDDRYEVAKDGDAPRA